MSERGMNRGAAALSRPPRFPASCAAPHEHRVENSRPFRERHRLFAIVGVGTQKREPSRDRLGAVAETTRLKTNFRARTGESDGRFARANRRSFAQPIRNFVLKVAYYEKRRVAIQIPPALRDARREDGAAAEGDFPKRWDRIFQSVIAHEPVRPQY